MITQFNHHSSKNNHTYAQGQLPAESMMGSDQLGNLIRNLHSQRAFSTAGSDFRIVETHISYVVLTGKYAYKFKKPVDLGFLDFSTLEKRRFYCHEELRLNRRLAKDLYLDVVEIHGSPEHPVLGRDGDAIEYAVKMRQFPEENRLDHVAARGDLRTEHIDQLATDIAAFHASLPPAKPGSLCGTPARIGDRMLENFRQIETNIASRLDIPAIPKLREWTLNTINDSQEDFEIRCREGFVRECHGDMHLGNMVLIDGQVRLFDCLEFARDLRWIDILSDVAFLLMDLDYRELPGFGRRFLSRYLEATSDYQGLPVLVPYLVYRALVRAKVAAISFNQHSNDSELSAKYIDSLVEHVELAEQYTERPPQGPIILMRGLSGTGKSHLAAQLVGAVGGIQIRSDVERKRLLDSPQPHVVAKIDAGAYAPEMTRKTYERLLALAYEIADAGFPAIVDATFLRTMQRTRFFRLARTAGLPILIVDLHASESTLITRIEARKDDASEATLEVLQHQIHSHEPLTEEEEKFAIRVDTDKPVDIERLASRIRRLSS